MGKGTHAGGLEGDREGWRVSLWTQQRRVTAVERLWLAVLDQACADAGSADAAVRAEAEAWWASEAARELAARVDVPWEALARLRAARGGLRACADGGGTGRLLGVRRGIQPRGQYQYRAPR